MNRSPNTGVGHALITMVEPYAGHERSYSRWYEDDHFFSAAMFAPWVFSGRRWTATHELQQLRSGGPASPAAPITQGCYLATYWIAPGHLQDYLGWSAASGVATPGRTYEARTHVFTSFQDHIGTVYRDADTPRDVFSLIDPSPGLVLEIVDASDAAARPELEDWLLNHHLPRVVETGGPAASAMLFRSHPVAAGSGSEAFAAWDKVSRGGRRLTILWFIGADPRTDRGWLFRDEGALLKATGMAELSLLAPFLPSKMGTNTYDDELRAPSSKDV